MEQQDSDYREQERQCRQEDGYYIFATEEDYQDYDFDIEQEGNYDTRKVGGKYNFTEQCSSNGCTGANCVIWALGETDKLFWGEA